MARGIYSDMPYINAKDYVVHYRADRKTWSVDRVGAGGTHTTIGSTRGFGTTEAVRKAIEADAHVKGVRNAEIHHNDGGAAGVLKDGRVYFFPGAFANDGYTHKVREASRKGPARHREPADEQAAHELVLYIDNTSDLSLLGPRGQGHDIAVNLMRKRAKGVYDPDLAVKLLEYLTEAGAKQYAKEFGSDSKWSDMFTPATRHEAAKELEETFRQAADAGDYSHLELKRGARETRRAAARQRGWDVIDFEDGRKTVINRVYFDSDMDSDQVQRSLIRHDGYPESISVVPRSDAVRGGSASPQEPRGHRMATGRPWAGSDANERAYYSVHNGLVYIIIDGPNDRSKEILDRARRVLDDLNAQKPPKRAQITHDVRINSLRKLIHAADEVVSGRRAPSGSARGPGPIYGS